MGFRREGEVSEFIRGQLVVGVGPPGESPRETLTPSVRFSRHYPCPRSGGEGARRTPTLVPPRDDTANVLQILLHGQGVVVLRLRGQIRFQRVNGAVGFAGLGQEYAPVAALQ